MTAEIVQSSSASANSTRTGESSDLRRALFRYGFSLASLAIPAALTLILRDYPRLNPLISLSFVLVVSASAWWGGFGAGILVSCATIPVLTLAATGGKIFWPVHFDPVGILALFLISLLVGAFARARKRIEHVLRAANDELEAKVSARTGELKQANTALQHRLAELESLYEESPVGLCFLDNDLRFVRINERLAAITGAPVAVHSGRKLRDLIPERLVDILEPLFRRVQQTGNPVLDFEITDPVMPDAEGQRTWMIACSPVTAESGAALGVQVILQDVTERKRSERALRQAHVDLKNSEEQFRNLANTIPQLCWIAHADGSIFWYNERWYRYTGANSEEMEGWGWQSVHDPEALPGVLACWKQSIATGKPFDMTFPLRGADGRFRPFLTRVMPVCDHQGSVVRWFGTNTDISEQKAMENSLRRANDSLRRANADLEQFAYSASHDLQEPIRNIAIYGEILNRRSAGLLDAKGKEALGFITAGARRMDMLVKDLLAYSQTARTSDETDEESEAAAALAGALSNLSAAIRETGAQVTHDTLPKLPMRESELQQIFQNLVGNAIKYRRENETPRVHIAAQPEGEMWRFSVQDNGIGISQQYRQTIFGLFKRLHTDRQYSGSGIGLAICQRIVERHGGRIWVESEIGKGSTFIFTIDREHIPARA